MKNYNWAAQSAHGAIVLSSSKPRKVTQVCSWVYDGNDFMIVGIARRNLNWKDSLIDLSKNDYIIKDGLLMATRKHAALIHAWADGAIIQYLDPATRKWFDIASNRPYWEESVEYRIKPTIRTVKFKNWYSSNGKVYAAYSPTEENNPDFVTWLDKDWQEVEIEL